MGGKLQYGPNDYRFQGPLEDPLNLSINVDDLETTPPPPQEYFGQGIPGAEEFLKLPNNADLAWDRVNSISKQISPNYNRPNIQPQEIPVEKARKFLDMGYGYVPGVDNEDFYSDTQGIFKTLGKGVLRIPALITTKLGQNIGYLGALANPSNWDGNVIANAADNTFSKFFATTEDKIKNDWLKTFNSSEDREKGFFGRMFTDLDFWTDDFVDGAAFMGSAWIPGYAMHKFKGGQKVMGALGKVMGKTITNPGAMSEIEAVAAGTNYFKNAQSYARNIDKYSGWAMATAGESLFEASEIKKNVYESLGVDKFGNLAINPATGQAYTEEEKREISGNAAKNGFLMNAALLSVSNLFELPYVTKIFGGGKQGAMGSVAGATRLGEEMVLDAGKNAWQKFMRSNYGALSKGLTAGIVREGLVEENVQLAIQRFNETYGSNGLMSNMLDYQTFTGLGSQVLAQTGEALKGQDQEASMNIGLGALLGGGMSSVVDFKSAKRNKLTTEEAIKTFNEAQTNWLKFGDIFKQEEYQTTDEQGNAITKTKTIFDANNEPTIDDQKIASVLSNAKSYVEAIGLANDGDIKSPLLRNILRDEAFSKFVNAHIKAENEDGLMQKLDDLNKAAPEDLAKLGFVKDGNFDSELSRYKNLASRIIGQNKMINDDIIFDDSKEDLARKNYLLDTGSKQAIYRSLSGEELKRYQDLKNELIDTNISSLSDGMVDQLNQIQFRINSQKQIIDFLKSSGQNKTQVEVYQKVLNNLENTQKRLLADNETTVKGLKKDDTGFYSYEKDGRNDPSVTSILNKKLAVLGQLQNHIDNLGSQWGFISDFKSGKQNFMSLFKETIVDPLNKKIEEENKDSVVSPEDEELLDVDLSDEDVDIDIKNADIPPVNLGGPSSDLMSYLKDTHQNLIDQGNLGENITFQNWIDSGAANSFVRLYNQKYGTSETLPGKTTTPTPPPGPTPPPPAPAPEEVISSAKLGPYVINIGDKINGEEVMSITDKSIVLGTATLDYPAVLAKLNAFGGRNIIRKGEKGKDDSKDFENGEIENVFETFTPTLNPGIQKTVNDVNSKVVYGGSDRVIEAGSKVNSLSDFYNIDIVSTSEEAKLIDRKRLTNRPNPNYPLVLGTPAVNVGTNVTLTADVDIKDFKEYNQLDPSETKGRKASDYFDTDGKIKKEAFNEFPIRIDTEINGEKVFLGYLPRTEWLNAKWPNGKHMNVADDIAEYDNVEKQKAKLSAIRKMVFDGHNISSNFTVNAVINAKSDGKLRTDSTFRKASEVLHPSTKIGIIRGGSIYTDNDTLVSQSEAMYDPAKIASGKEGWPVALINTPTGNKPLMTFLSVPKLRFEHQEFIVTAWKAFHNIKNAKDPASLKEDLNVVKAVYNAYGIVYEPGTVVDFNILKNYVNDYITYTSSKNQYDSLRKDGTGQLNITEKGELVAWVVKTREKSKDLTIAATVEEFDKKSDNFYEKLSELYYNVKMSSEFSNGINSASKMKFLSSVGGKVRISSSPLTYNEYIMNILETNLEKGRPSVAGDENSSYIYFANPVLTFDVVSSNQMEIEQDNKKKQLPPAPEQMTEAQNEIRNNWSLSLEGIRDDSWLGPVTTVFEPNGTYSTLYGKDEKDLVQKIEDYYMAQLEGTKKPKGKPAPVSTDVKYADLKVNQVLNVTSKEDPAVTGTLTVSAIEKPDFIRFDLNFSDGTKDSGIGYSEKELNDLFSLTQPVPSATNLKGTITPTSTISPDALLDLNMDFGDIAEDIGDVEEPPTGGPSFPSIKTTLEEFKKTCD